MKWVLTALVLPICLSLAGYDAHAEKPATATSDQIRLAANPGYFTPKGVRQESLGRLIFDVPRDMEWGIHKMNNQGKRYGFPGGKAFLEYGTVEIEGTEIHVMDSALKSDLADRVESDDSRKDNSIRELTKGIETSLSLLEDIRKPDYKPEDPENLKLNIEAHEASITDYQARIKRLSTEHYPIDMGIPDSAAYQSGGILHGYLWREGRLYCFDKGFDRIPTAEDKKEFIQFVKAFRIRKLYEIPKEPGICLPYGFVSDDGKSQYTVSVSIRFKDRPNVVWNFNTGTVESQPADFGISSDALTNIGFMQNLPNIPGRKVLAAKDEPIQIGALMARQWGAVVTLRPYQNLPFLETYEFSIYRRGVEGSQMLPYLAIHMRGIGKEFDDILKTQPPPYRETKARQEALFKSIRIRPTTPLMPEWAAIQ